MEENTTVESVVVVAGMVNKKGGGGRAGWVIEMGLVVGTVDKGGGRAGWVIVMGFGVVVVGMMVINRGGGERTGWVIVMGFGVVVVASTAGEEAGAGGDFEAGFFFDKNRARRHIKRASLTQMPIK